MSGQQRAVFMGVWVLPNANSLDVISRGARRAQAHPAQSSRPGMQATVAFDSTNYINNAIDEVVTDAHRDGRSSSSSSSSSSLGSLRSVLVPLVAIPVSLIGAVFLMQVFGFTLNLLTLLAVVLAVGLVVDDAIVVVENVERNIREGKTPFEAALIGARELVGPIIAMTDHARRGLRADRLSGRPDRRALPRVRVHAGRRGVHLRRRRAHPVAHDVVAPAHGRPHEQLALPTTIDPRVRGVYATRYDRALAATLRRLAARSTRSGSCSRW